jgi:hypothetical protein
LECLFGFQNFVGYILTFPGFETRRANIYTKGKGFLTWCTPHANTFLLSTRFAPDTEYTCATKLPDDFESISLTCAAVLLAAASPKQRRLTLLLASPMSAAVECAAKRGLGATIMQTPSASPMTDAVGCAALC